MRKILEQFIDYLDDGNKESAIKYIFSLLNDNKMDVIHLYTDILTPSLNHMVCKTEEEHYAIYKEHLKTAIVRTIIECAYPYVLDKRDSMGLTRNETVIILCPPGEQHDLGARMATDFFTIAGFHTIFLGSDTPYQDLCQVLPTISPVLIAISITNYYNLVTAKRMITEIRKYIGASTKIVVGGYAFHDDENKYKQIGADSYVNSFEEILKLRRNEVVG